MLNHLPMSLKRCPTTPCWCMVTQFQGSLLNWKRACEVVLWTSMSLEAKGRFFWSIKGLKNVEKFWKTLYNYFNSHKTSMKFQLEPACDKGQTSTHFFFTLASVQQVNQNHSDVFLLRKEGSSVLFCNWLKYL